MTDNNNQPIANIKDGDVVIFFNFRTDRGRELTEALSQRDFHEQNMHKLNLYYVTLTNYDETFTGINVVFNKENLTDTLGEVLEKHNTIPVEIEEGFKNANCVVIMNNHNAYKKLDIVSLLKNANKPCLFIDCWRLYDRKIFSNSQDIIYSGLGVV